MPIVSLCKSKKVPTYFTFFFMKYFLEMMTIQRKRKISMKVRAPAALEKILRKLKVPLIVEKENHIKVMLLVAYLKINVTIIGVRQKNMHKEWNLLKKMLFYTLIMKIQVIFAVSNYHKLCIHTNQSDQVLTIFEFHNLYLIRGGLMLPDPGLGQFL